MTVRGCLYGLIVVVVGLSLFSGAAVAEPFVDLNPDSLDGEGTTTSPYEISNASELQAMGGNLSANYTLDGTIEAANTSAWNDGAGFEPIGNETDPFTGTFSGNEKTIQGLSINRTTDNPVGLFGATDGALIERVGLVDVDIVGNASGGSTIFVGGLVGNMSGDVTNTSISGSVTGSDTVGGLVGNLNGTVTDSYATSSVDGGSRVGGLVGFNANDGDIRTSYAVGTVDDDGTATTAGGLVGDNRGSVENSYWDTESTNQTTSVAGTGLTTAEMSGNDATVNMDGFEFYDHWIPTSEDYPVLTWQFFAESTGGGDGSESNPFIVADEYGLQAMSANLTASYELSGDIDASDTDQWNDGDGFDSIGDDTDGFSGSFDGAGFSIEELTIDRENYVGLFGSISTDGSVSNITLVDATIITPGPDTLSAGDFVGSLSGSNDGTISESGATGSVRGTSQVGGLIGRNDGTVSQSYFEGSWIAVPYRDDFVAVS